MGGYVALAFAKKYPTDLRGSLLIDTRAEADTAEGKQGREKMIQLAREKGSPAVADADDAENGRPACRAESAGGRAGAAEIMEALPGADDRACAGGDARSAGSIVTNLPSIAVPTLIIVGEMDAITPPMVAEAMHSAIPNSELAVIKGAGHMSPMEQPDRSTWRSGISSTKCGSNRQQIAEIAKEIQVHWSTAISARAFGLLSVIFNGLHRIPG